MLLNRSRSPLMSCSDRSVQRRFKSNTPMANGSRAKLFTQFARNCIKQCNAAVCCSETNSSALSLYFRWQNLAKHNNINFLLTELLYKISITFGLV